MTLELQTLNRNATTSLHHAIMARDLDACRLLLDSGADPNASVSIADQRSPLARSLHQGFTEGALLLIERGAAVGPTAKRAIGPLPMAASLGLLEVCQAMLDQGAPVDGPDDTGQTPLFLAATRLHVPVARLLIKHGADANAITASGSTPLRVTSINPEPEATEMIRVLIAAGADPSALTVHSNTLFDVPLSAFQCAVAHGRDRNVALLIDEYGQDPGQLTVDGVSMVDLAKNAETKETLIGAMASRAIKEAMTSCDDTTPPASAGNLPSPL